MAKSNIYAADVIGPDDKKHIVLYEEFTKPIKIMDRQEAANLTLNIIDSLDIQSREWIFSRLVGDGGYKQTFKKLLK